MNKTHVKRLMKLADRIEAEPDRYDQRIWVGFGNHAAFADRADYSAEAARQECGTVACMAGHALLMSPKYQSRVEEQESFQRHSGAWSTHGWQATVYNVYTGERVDDEAEEAGEYLGLSENEANWLFNSWWYPSGDPGKRWTQKTVAKRTAAHLRKIAEGADPMKQGVHL